ncbi:MAG TPA: J domain-containing protein, partial [Actinomycetota bacterium]|nr:J domain-containing protein [Actinomycetota bacterium]
MDAVTRAVTSGEDLYGLLGVPPDASDDDIRHAYRALAREHHPDANPRHAPADGFRRVAAAYEILGDERDRAAYDRALLLGRLATERRLGPGPVASP